MAPQALQHKLDVYGSTFFERGLSQKGPEILEMLEFLEKQVPPSVEKQRRSEPFSRVSREAREFRGSGA